MSRMGKRNGESEQSMMNLMSDCIFHMSNRPPSNSNQISMDCKISSVIQEHVHTVQPRYPVVASVDKLCEWSELDQHVLGFTVRWWCSLRRANVKAKQVNMDTLNIAYNGQDKWCSLFLHCNCNGQSFIRFHQLLAKFRLYIAWEAIC